LPERRGVRSFSRSVIPPAALVESINSLPMKKASSNIPAVKKVILIIVVALFVFLGWVALGLVNPQNFAHVLGAIAWPAFLGLILFLFRNEISDVIQAIEQLCWGDKLGKRAIPPPNRLLPEEIPNLKNQSKPASLFWLGHDITMAMSSLFNQNEKPLLLKYIKQVRSHASRAGALSPDQEQILVRIYRLIETSPGNISKADAQTAIRQLSVVRDKLGGIVNKWQDDFGGSWDTGAWPE
jgi:hypothetical protein